MGKYSIQREVRSYSARARRLIKTITHADLTEAANGSPQDVALGTLRPGAVMLAPPAVKLTTQFTGGGATSVGMTIGTAAAPTLIATSFDVLGGTASGLFVRMTQGAQQQVPAGGQSVVARFTPDGAHNLAGLTAGAVEVEVYWAVPDGRPIEP